MRPSLSDEYGVWIYCQHCKSWIDLRAVDDIVLVGPDEATFHDAYCETNSRSAIKYGDRPTTKPESFASEEAGEGANEE